MVFKKFRELDLRMSGTNLPERSDCVAWNQLVELTQIQPADVAELLELGWIEPAKTGADEYLFRLKDVYRIIRLMRLVKDLDVSLNSGSIIVDLLERVEELEKEIKALKRLV
ncbi:chaperone modulator CbpM [Pseudodesulfovibrio tunisiensis]|uniref:chaperone modulator CbpM n=1 Tax=Pseudodesulfovibrio tunisiensis TaxID=463192 RepID=UPI001FB55BBF|nr:chaperone modulator CbpM [Pseudodesulfovibrio tunisiensis]